MSLSLRFQVISGLNALKYSVIDKLPESLFPTTLWTRAMYDHTYCHSTAYWHWIPTKRNTSNKDEVPELKPRYGSIFLLKFPLKFRLSHIKHCDCLYD